MTSTWFYKFFEDGLWNMLEEELTATHGLAKNAVNNVTDSIWMEEIPRCIFDILLSKLLLFFFRVLYFRFIMK
jgi:hypothetical protein